ncbi:MAG: AAA family ATPase [Candidatus Aminicenantes bacterium]|nr:AAA family ATPase [Candidatus Aminicenantes bacterium]
MTSLQKILQWRHTGFNVHIKVRTETKEDADPLSPLIIFDEIHKFKDWKNYLKGVYDQFHDQYQFLVSGSGRLDIYQRGGDSLAGRYYLFHLWPFTLAELGGRNLGIKEFLRSPLSIPSLASDLRVSYNSIRNWLFVFELFFLVFSIYPWTKKISLLPLINGSARFLRAGFMF